MKLFATLAIGAALAANFFAAPLHADDHQLRTEPYTFETRDGQSVEAELGHITVIENRTSGSNRTIELAFVRFPSTAPKPGPPIIYLAGGPGGSGIGTARGTRFPLFMAMREFGDVIAFDQRGTGESEPSMRCPNTMMIPLDRPMDPVALQPMLAKAARTCADAMREQGIDLSAYNTNESADDLNDLREALGAKHMTLWGISYGTHLALAAMKRHGDRVDRVILAGLEALHHTYKLPSDGQALLEQIAKLAAKDDAVRARVPNLLGSIERLLARLEREPVTVQVVDPRSGQAVGVTMGTFDLQAILSSMLRGPANFATMPDLVARLEDGDWMALALPVAMQRIGGGSTSAMALAMDCASGMSAKWQARIAREAGNTLLGDAINWPFPGVCVGLGVADAGEAFRAPVKSKIPALLISGTLDGRTPVANGNEVAKHLKRSAHLVIEGAGHSDPLFLSSPEILETMKAFMRGERIKNRRIKLAPVEFVEPRLVAKLDPSVLARCQGAYQIAEGDVRRVMAAGPLLFTMRGSGGRPFALRPMSETEFFYEGTGDRVRFVAGADGNIAHMLVFRNGSDEGEMAVKVE